MLPAASIWPISLFISFFHNNSNFWRFKACSTLALPTSVLFSLFSPFLLLIPFSYFSFLSFFFEFVFLSSLSTLFHSYSSVSSPFYIIAQASSLAQILVWNFMPNLLWKLWQICYEMHRSEIFYPIFELSLFYSRHIKLQDIWFEFW